MEIPARHQSGGCSDVDVQSPGHKDRTIKPETDTNKVDASSFDTGGEVVQRGLGAVTIKTYWRNAI
jgi:hypothetical protein